MNNFLKISHFKACYLFNCWLLSKGDWPIC